MPQNISIITDVANKQQTKTDKVVYFKLFSLVNLKKTDKVVNFKLFSLVNFKKKLIKLLSLSHFLWSTLKKNK